MREQPLSAQDKYWAKLFRDVFFNTNGGAEVFAKILDDLGFWSTVSPEDPEAAQHAAHALRNYAVYLLELTGLATTHNYENMVRAWITSRLPEPENKEFE